MNYTLYNASNHAEVYFASWIDNLTEKSNGLSVIMLGNLLSDYDNSVDANKSFKYINYLTHGSIS